MRTLSSRTYTAVTAILLLSVALLSVGTRTSAADDGGTNDGAEQSIVRELEEAVIEAANVPRDWTQSDEVKRAKEQPAEAPTPTAPAKKFPKWSKVEKRAHTHFTDLEGHKKGDLISQGDLKGLFKELEKLGWSVEDQRKLSDQLLPKNDYVVRQLRSRKGRDFMRHVSSRPGAYDRLDRLRRMPYGKRRIREMIDSPGGYTLLLYMTLGQQGKNMGRSISRGKNGRNFNQPTGRIYTSRAFLKQLKKSYDKVAASQPDAKSKSK